MVAHHRRLDVTLQGKNQASCLPDRCAETGGLVSHATPLARFLAATTYGHIAPSIPEALANPGGSGIVTRWIIPAPVAQLDRASVFGTEGYRFESCRV
jgi:hypothetical protein